MRLPEWSARLLLVCGSLLLVCLVIEVVSRAYPGALLRGAVRTPAELDRLVQSESERVGSPYRRRLQRRIHKLGRPGVTFHSYGLDYTATATYNSLGLRAPEPAALGAERPVLLVVGDSFVEGVQLPVEETLPAQLERALAERGPSWWVVNAGVGGTGTVNQLHTLEPLLPAYRPRRVLLVFFIGNDLRNNSLPLDALFVLAARAAGNPHESPVLQVGRGYYWRDHGVGRFRYVAAGTPLRTLLPQATLGWLETSLAESAACGQRLARPPGGHWLGGLTARSQALRLLAVRRGHTARVLCRPRLDGLPIDLLFQCDARRELQEDAWAATRFLLRRFHAAVAAQGSELTVAILPDRLHVRGGDLAPALGPRQASRCSAEPRPQARLARLLDELQIPHLDLTPALRDSPRPAALYLPIDGHLNAAGQRVVAERLADFLARD